MDERTIRAYDQLAKEYDEETATFWDLFPRTFFDAFAQLVQGDVLDVGCGPGRDGLLLKECGVQVTCLDAAPAMIRACEAKGLHGVVGDFHAMPFKDASFDGAWAYTSLLHVPKAELPNALDELRRVLKDGGVLGLGMIEGDAEGYRETPGVHMSRWFSFYQQEELEEALRNHGFDLLLFERFQPGRKHYLNFIARKIRLPDQINMS